LCANLSGTFAAVHIAIWHPKAACTMAACMCVTHASTANKNTLALSDLQHGSSAEGFALHTCGGMDIESEACACCKHRHRLLFWGK
jgi:hypothetical protein